MSEDNENAGLPQDESNIQGQGHPVKKHKVKKVKVKTKKKKNKGIHIGVGSIVLVLFCTFLLIVSTFLQLNITHFILPVKFFTGDACSIDDFLYTIKYIPQIPVAILVVGLLGRKYGIVSILLYILIGLFFLPVFALGGGWRYIFEYGFGYILAYIPAAVFVGTILKRGYTYTNIGKAVLIGVLVIHIVGILYMMCLAGLRHAGVDFMLFWISAQSGIKILYDIIFSILAVLVCKYARIILWFYF